MHKFRYIIIIHYDVACTSLALLNARHKVGCLAKLVRNRERQTTPSSPEFWTLLARVTLEGRLFTPISIGYTSPGWVLASLAYAPTADDKPWPTWPTPCRCRDPARLLLPPAHNRPPYMQFKGKARKEQTCQHLPITSVFRASRFRTRVLSVGAEATKHATVRSRAGVFAPHKNTTALGQFPRSSLSHCLLSISSRPR